MAFDQSLDLDLVVEQLASVDSVELAYRQETDSHAVALPELELERHAFVVVERVLAVALLVVHFERD